MEFFFFVPSVVAVVSVFVSMFVFVLWRCSLLFCSLAADGVVVCGLSISISIFFSFPINSLRRCRGLAVLAPRLLLPVPHPCPDPCPDRYPDRVSDRVSGRFGLVSVPFLVVAPRLNVVVDDIDIDEQALLVLLFVFCVALMLRT